MLGDFNSHSTLWESGGRSDSAGRELEKLLADDSTDLGLLNDEFGKTFLDKRTGNYSCLDLCFCSHNLLSKGESIVQKDLGSDHFPVKNVFGFKLQHVPISIKRRWKIETASWDNFKSELLRVPYQETWPTDATSGNQMIVNRILKAAEATISRTSGEKKI